MRARGGCSALVRTGAPVPPLFISRALPHGVGVALKASKVKPDCRWQPFRERWTSERFLEPLRTFHQFQGFFRRGSEGA